MASLSSFSIEPLSGTTFPSSPPVGFRFRRTDLDGIYFWSGVRWLSETLYQQLFISTNTSQGNGWLKAGNLNMGNGRGVYLEAAQLVRFTLVGGTGSSLTSADVRINRIDTVTDSNSTLEQIAVTGGTDAFTFKGTLSGVLSDSDLVGIRFNNVSGNMDRPSVYLYYRKIAT